MAQSTKPLPKLADLHHDPSRAFEMDELNTLLNQPVPREWIRQHPTVKVKNIHGQMVPLEYLPVDKVEFLLTRIFQEWRREIISVVPAFQSLIAIVRLHVKNPVTGEWTSHDGTGGCPIQTNKDSSAADLSQIKSAAVQMAAPAAVSYALKDAAECYGTLFGKDLNRKNTVIFQGAYGDAPQPRVQQQAQQAGQFIQQAAAQYVPPPEAMVQHQQQQQQQQFPNYSTDFQL